MFNILSHKGNAHQTILKFCVTSTIVAMIKKTTNAGKEGGLGEEPSHTGGEDVN
jgi:hypothetical protein